MPKNQSQDSILLKQLKVLKQFANDDGLDLAEKHLDNEIYKLERKIRSESEFD